MLLIFLPQSSAVLTLLSCDGCIMQKFSLLLPLPLKSLFNSKAKILQLPALSMSEIFVAQGIVVKICEGGVGPPSGKLSTDGWMFCNTEIYCIQFRMPARSSLIQLILNAKHLIHVRT